MENTTEIKKYTDLGIDEPTAELLVKYSCGKEPAAGAAQIAKFFIDLIREKREAGADEETLKGLFELLQKEFMIPILQEQLSQNTDSPRGHFDENGLFWFDPKPACNLRFFDRRVEVPDIDIDFSFEH